MHVQDEMPELGPDECLVPCRVHLVPAGLPDSEDEPALSAATQATRIMNKKCDV